jgi:hypothetical protein
MAAATPEAGGGPGVAVAGPAPVVLRWPLPGCRPDSLTDLFSPRALAELARAAGPAGGAAVLELGGHTLQAPAGRPGVLHLLERFVPPAGLHSLALRNGTLALRAGWRVAFVSTQPFAVSLERIKLTRPAPTSGSGAGPRAALEPGSGYRPMVTFSGAVSGRMVECRVELCPAGPAGYSMRQGSVGVNAQVGHAGMGHAAWGMGHAGRCTGWRGRQRGGGGEAAVACRVAWWAGGARPGGGGAGGACRVARWAP